MDKHLTFAFKHCPRLSEGSKSNRNLELILNVLVPVKLRLGYKVSTSVCKKYRCVEQYIHLVDAMQTGNINLYERTMCQHRVQFMRSGIFSVIAELEERVFARLVRLV